MKTRFVTFPAILARRSYSVFSLFSESVSRAFLPVMLKTKETVRSLFRGVTSLGNEKTFKILYFPNVCLVKLPRIVSEICFGQTSGRTCGQNDPYIPPLFSKAGV